MKRLLIFLVVAFLFYGCGPKEVKIVDPVNFYYCNKTISYSSPEAVISYEIREANGLRNSWVALLDFYLRGPSADHLYSPFPESVTVKAFTISNGQCTVTLSNEFSSLTGIDLTLACSCLSRTIMELTGVKNIEIKFTDPVTGKFSSVTMDENSILLHGSSLETIPVQE